MRRQKYVDSTDFVNIYSFIMYRLSLREVEARPEVRYN